MIALAISIKERNQETRSINWSKLVHHVKFKEAPDARWQDIQVNRIILSCNLDYAMVDFDIGSSIC